MSWRRIAGFRLVSANPERLTRFYAAIGFTVAASRPIAGDEMAVLGLSGGGRRWPLTLGPSGLGIDAFENPGRPYPEEADAASLCFQHLALVTDDAASAWRRAAEAGASPISRECPVTLPASAGGVTAVKFRDPDGHPLEFLQFPEGGGGSWSGRGVLGIDHSAISVSDVAASTAFYRERDLTRGDATLNHGPTQVALDGLDDVAVDVQPLRPREGPPHLELLGYRTPRPRPCGAIAPNDIAAIRIVWSDDADALLRDPDGHFHQSAKET